MQEAAKTGMIARGIFSIAIELVGSSELGPALLRFGLSLPRARGVLRAPVLAPAGATRAPSQKGLGVDQWKPSRRFADTLSRTVDTLALDIRNAIPLDTTPLRSITRNARERDWFPEAQKK